MILEPEKFEANYPVIDAASRQTKIYKEQAGDEMILLRKEHDNLLAMQEKLNKNEILQSILTGNVQAEVPMIGELASEMWKGKADLINIDEKLVIDLKTTSDIDKFFNSAKRYNYDSQAYIYRELFGYDMVFVVIDKNSHQLGFYDCSDNFYRNGKEKVQNAVFNYRMYWKDQANFDWDNYMRNETL